MSPGFVLPGMPRYNFDLRCVVSDDVCQQSGASKHYAYIEMPSQSVADIVADTMNNYLLMGHLLKCQVCSILDLGSLFLGLIRLR